MSKRRSISTYAVTVEYGEHRWTVHYSARSPAAARYDAYLSFSGAYDHVSFKDFLRLCKAIRKVPHQGRYEGVKRAYGLDVSVGDRIELPGGKIGTVTEPAHDSVQHVSFIYDDGNHARLCHPTEFRVIE